MNRHERADRVTPRRSAATASRTDDAARSGSDPASQHLRPGQVVQARLRGVVHWTGTVDTVSVALGVVWIRENGLGERKLLDLQEYQVHPQEGAEK
ncbi:hypothetical protein ACT4S5_09485 [Kocuria oceani]|uniref:hypothetical protein n=1 Tax=Kocuria oceani TaxID=988827 RepID=UPI004035FADE